MKLSKLIKKLEALKAKHGDLEACFETSDEQSTFEDVYKVQPAKEGFSQEKGENKDGYPPFYEVTNKNPEFIIIR